MGLFGNSLSGSNHSSPIGALGGSLQKYTDPLAMIPGVGDKWVNLTSNKIPSLVNSGLSKVMTPFDKIDETINPVRKIPIVDKVGDWIHNKPGDTLGMVAGAVYGAPALAGAMGGGSGAAGGVGAVDGGAAAAGGGVAGGGDALGSLAGLSGQSGAVMGGGGAISSVAPGVTAGGSTALGSTAGMTGSWGPVAGGASSPLLNPQQAQLLSQALGKMGQGGGGQPQNVQLGAANGQDPQAAITPGPTMPAVNPAMRQQIMAQMLMRGY